LRQDGHEGGDPECQGDDLFHLSEFMGSKRVCQSTMGETSLM
jgi:hypothetical protein